MDFEGKKILITGASNGIGRETAICLDSMGAETILVARRDDKLQQVSAQMKNNCICVPFDLSKSEDIENIFLELIERDIKLDGMVYCAGVADVNLVKNVSLEDVQKSININAIAFYMLCKYFALPKYSNKESSIVGISSIASLKHEPGMSLYAMTKEAMNVTVKVMAKEFVKRKIRLNNVLPAQVMSKMACETNDWTEDEIEEVRSYQPFGIIPIEQVVNCITFLLSEKAKYITGECIAISGGYKTRD